MKSSQTLLQEKGCDLTKRIGSQTRIRKYQSDTWRTSNRRIWKRWLKSSKVKTTERWRKRSQSLYMIQIKRVLYMVCKFQSVINTYKLFQSDGTNAEMQKAAWKIFSKFKRVLQGNSRDTWQSALDEAHSVWNENEFYDCSTRLICKIMRETRTKAK